MSRSRLAFALLAVVSFPTFPSLAHETWLTAVVPAPASAPARGRQAKAPRPAPQRPVLVAGDSGAVELSTGSRFPVTENAVKPERIDRTYVRFGSGRPLPMTGAREDGPVTRLEATYAGAGLAVLAVQLKPSFIEIPAAEFDAYLDEIGAAEALADRRKRKETRKPGREVYTKIAKTFARVVDPKKKLVEAPRRDTAAEPLGLPLELVLGADPSGLRAGGTLTATLLSEGKPAAGQAVRVFAADGSASTLTTGADGTLSVPLAREGRLLLAATAIRRTTKADRRRGDVFRKADWESVWTSLALDVSAGPPRVSSPKRPKAAKKPKRG